MKTPLCVEVLSGALRLVLTGFRRCPTQARLAEWIFASVSVALFDRCTSSILDCSCMKNPPRILQLTL